MQRKIVFIQVQLKDQFTNGKETAVLIQQRCMRDQSEVYNGQTDSFFLLEVGIKNSSFLKTLR